MEGESGGLPERTSTDIIKTGMRAAVLLDKKIVTVVPPDFGSGPPKCGYNPVQIVFFFRRPTA
jgi:hypothetical protein